MHYYVDINVKLFNKQGQTLVRLDDTFSQYLPYSDNKHALQC